MESSLKISWSTIQQYPGLKPDYFGDIKSFSKKVDAFHYKAIFEIFYHKLIQVKQDGSFNSLLITFCMNWNNISFSHFKGNLPVHKQVLKIMFRGLHIELRHIFNMRINFILAMSFIWV